MISSLGWRMGWMPVAPLNFNYNIMAKVQLPVRIESDDLELLKKYAKEDNRPLSNYVDTVLKSQIALEKQKSGEKK